MSESELEANERMLSGVAIESVELSEVKGRVLISSISLSNGFIVHLAPSTLGVVLYKWEEASGKPNTARNTAKNRTQARSGSRKASRTKRKASLSTTRKANSRRKSST